MFYFRRPPFLPCTVATSKNTLSCCIKVHYALPCCLNSHKESFLPFPFDTKREKEKLFSDPLKNILHVSLQN